MITSDTGDEYQETREHLERKTQLLAERGVLHVHLTPELGFHSPAWPSLHGQWARNNTIGGVAFHSTCSPNLKLEPINRFLNHLLARRYGYVERHGRSHKAALYGDAQDDGPLRVLIGFSAGEERRVCTAPQRYVRDTIERVFPLIDLGLTRAGCQDVTRTLGHEVPFPSNCRSCHFASRWALLRLHRREPQAFEAWAAAEHRKLTHPKWQGTRNHGVFANNLTLRENLEEAHKTFGHLATKELDALRMSRGHANKSRF